MRMTNWIPTLLLATIIALAGCGKEKPPAPVQEGVTLDLPKLREAFATASPDLQNLVSEVVMRLRYGEHSSALAALTKLASVSSLTEPQKKIVSQVTEQVKQVASKTPSPPAR
jgi:hypothetical protein